jgi:putative ABC transport system permease protein
MDWPFTLEGQTPREAERNPLLNFQTVTPGYFDTMRIPILRGRPIDERDREGQPGVVVVSESLARRAWPGQDAVGRRLKIPLPATEYHDAWLTVVGVAADARYRELSQARFDLYMSHRQSDHRAHHVVVRTAGETAAVTAAIVRAVREHDPEHPAPAVVPLTAAVGQALAVPRFAARVFAGFGMVSVLLAALGLYGLVAHSVGRRTREIGLRVALGARPRDVVRLVLREGLGPALAGVAAGLAGAALAVRLLQALLFGVRALDPLTFVSASVLLLAVAALAAAVPARRAVRVSPAAVLRQP